MGHQIETDLANAKSPAQAFQGLEENLLSLDKAEAARKRPEAPPPQPEPTCWVHTWLKSKKLEGHSGSFIKQALESREDVLEAPLDHKTLENLGVSAIGERCKIMRYIEEE